MPETIRRPRRRARAIGAGAGAGLIGLALLALPWVPPPDVAPLSWGAFFGRFHPLVVHFPIVLGMLLLILEGLAWATKRAALRAAVPVVLGLAVASTLAAVAFGYLLYASGDYGGDLARDHLWGGVALGLLLVAAAAVYAARPEARALYLGLLVAANGALVVTSHLGGSLTHGEAFITDAFPGFRSVPVEQKPLDEMHVFGDLLLPAFEVRCLTCHNENKSRGDLVMTSAAALMRGGKSERPTVVPGDAEASEILRRIHLPPGDDDRMPPEGKPGLSPEASALLAAWIDAGAAEEARLADLDDPAALAHAQALRPALAVAQRRRLRDRAARDALLAELEPLARQHGLDVTPDPEADSMRFALAMRVPPESVGDEALAALRGYGDAFSRVSLVGSDVTDDGLYHLGAFPNLRALYLQRTAIDGSGLVYLAGLPALEEVGLAHTPLTGAHALHLLRLPALRCVYLFGTAVEPDVLRALRAHHPDVAFEAVEGPLQ